MVTNLRGIPYGVPFKWGTQDAWHVMQAHGDRRHFQAINLGTGPGDNSWAQGDPSDVFDCAAIGSQNPQSRPFMAAGIASGAFPIALAPQEIDARAIDYDRIGWPSLLTGERLLPHWPDDYTPATNTGLAYFAPDGGIIDNEPFEYAHRALLAGWHRAERARC